MSPERRTETASIRTTPAKREKHNLPRVDAIPARCPRRKRSLSSYYSNKPPEPPIEDNNDRWRNDGDGKDEEESSERLQYDPVEANLWGLVGTLLIIFAEPHFIRAPQDKQEVFMYSGFLALSALAGFTFSSAANIHLQQRRKK